MIKETKMETETRPLTKEAVTPEFVLKDALAKIDMIEDVIVTIRMKYGGTASLHNPACEDPVLALMGKCQENYINRHLFGLPS